jgi:hypothetical protein
MGRVYGKSVKLIVSSCPHGIRPSSQGRPNQGGAVSATLRYSRENPPVKRDHGRAGFLTPKACTTVRGGSTAR